LPFQGSRKSQLSGLTPSNGPVMDVARIKIIMPRAIYYQFTNFAKVPRNIGNFFFRTLQKMYLIWVHLMNFATSGGILKHMFEAVNMNNKGQE
jgi:hypothetical protein